METLQILKTFVLAEIVRVQDECLAHHRGNTTKDIVLLEAQKLVPNLSLIRRLTVDHSGTLYANGATQ